MRTLFIFKGLPGCGKSTEAAALIKREPDRWLRVNRDDLRSMVVGPGNNPHARSTDRENCVRSFKDALIRQAFREGYDVIVDDTHLVPQTVKKLHELAMGIGDVKVIEKGINESVATCIERDSKRTGHAHVGEKVIKDMAKGAGLDKGRKLSDKESYYPPRWAPGGTGDSTITVFDPASPLPKAVICDLDGTLSFLNGRSPYDAKDCDKDPPNLPVIEAVKAIHERGVKILFTSGREDKYREPTMRFIAEHLPSYPVPPGESTWYKLFMRPSGDMRKDNIIKTELFDANIRDKYNVVFCLDDRNQVVDQWREMGLACFQVAPGNF